MSGAQTSTFYPVNQMLQDTAQGVANYYAPQKNQLAIQAAQQDVSSHDIEMAARVSQSLLGLGDESAMAAAYQGAVANAQQYGYLKNAPSVFPGKARLQQIALMGTPSEKLAEFSANRQFGAALNPPQPPGAGTTGAGTGTAAAPPVPSYGTTAAQAPPEYEPYFQEASRIYGIPVDVLKAQAAQESSFNPNATGGAGEIGIMQIHPKTAASPGFGIAGVGDPSSLRDPRTNIMFGAAYLAARAKAANADLSTPQGQAAALTAYNGGGDPQYAAHVFGRMAPPAGRAAPTGTAGQPVIIGDSIASSQGLGGQGVIGASPRAVLAQITDPNRPMNVRGRDVVLSGGASNNPADVALVEQQVNALKDQGAQSVTVVGVGDNQKLAGANQQLQQIAQRTGARFVPLGATGADGVHPADYGALKVAVQPPQGGPQPSPVTGRYQVASNAPVAPPGSTAPPAGTVPPTVPQPPQNQALPGQPNGPPAPQQTQAQAAPQPQITGPQPPALPPTNANGLDARQQQMVDAAARTGRISPADQVKMQDTFRQQNIALQQKAYSDYIQAQQLAVAQGHLTIDQANSNLEYWKAANDLDITKTGDELIVTNKRTGQVVSRTPITPDMRPETLAMTDIARLAPKIRDGTATQAEQDRYATAVDTWRQPELVDSKITGEKLRVNKRELPANFPPPQGEQGSGGTPKVVVPGFSPQQQEIERDPAKAKVAEEQYGRDSKEIPSVTDTVRAAQTDNIRIKEMQDILNNISTGPGSTTKAQIAAWFQRWAPAALTGWERESANLDGAAAAEAFQKLAFKGSVAQERQSSSRGGFMVTKLFQQLNPGMDLLNPANKSLLNMQLISNQADIDYGQAANDHFTSQEQRFGDTHKYTTLQQFERQWVNQRNPEVYAAAIGALNGQPPEQWSKGLSDAEYKRALDIVSRANPAAIVNGKSGRISMQPNSGSTAAPVTVQTPADAQSLAPGTPYTTPDGRKFVR